MNGATFHFIDATIIMYALGGPHSHRAPCKSLLEKIKNETLQVVCNTEVLQEILYRYFSIQKPAIAELAYSSMINFCQLILPVTLRDTDRALEILKQNPKITSRDAIHASTMLNNGIKEILSTTPHFDLIPGIRRIDPSATG